MRQHRTCATDPPLSGISTTGSSSAIGLLQTAQIGAGVGREAS
jgi:hypothetical protein